LTSGNLGLFDLGIASNSVFIEADRDAVAPLHAVAISTYKISQ